MFSPFYSSAFVWNLAHGIANVLVPLYALHLGMGGVALGSLVALPVVLQLVFNLVGGVWVDRLGPKNVLYISCAASLGACLIYAASSGYAGLFAGQCLFVLSRAAFWPANWSLGSQLPGDRSRNMGRLNSVTNAGYIVGTAGAGMLISAVGFRPGFLANALIAIAALALTALIRHARRARPGRPPGIFATYAALARERPLYFAMACAFLSVIPFTLTNSFHPVLLVAGGFTSEEIGWLLTLRAVGAIFAGIALARLVRSAESRSVPVWCCAGIGFGLVASAASSGAWAMAASLFVLGVASGLISIYFQLLISAISEAERRGSAMSYGGIGWNLSNMLTPLCMGTLTDWLSIHHAFYIVGASLLLYAAALPALHRWAFAARSPSAVPDARGTD